MLNKVCTIPEFIYRTNSEGYYHGVGSRFLPRSKEVFLKPANYSIRQSNSYKNATFTKVENKPLSNVKLINNLQASIDNEFSVHVDENFIYDVAENNLNKNGRLHAEYVFCTISAKTHLVRVNSPLYNEIAASSRRRKAPRVKKNALEPGGIYVTPGGRKSMFLGFVDTYRPDGHYGSIPGYSFSKKQMLFYYLARNEEYKIPDLTNLYRFDFKRSHSFTEKVDKITLPSSYLTDLKNSMIKSFKNKLVEDQETEWGRSANNVSNTIRHYCQFVNIQPSGSQKAEIFDFQKYVVYI